jgi:uncharacterized protein (DUF488 family)
MELTLNHIYTIAEAAKLWGMDTSTIRVAIRKNRFKTDEIRKSEGTWLIQREAMESVYGAIEEYSTLYTVGYEGITIEEFVTNLRANKINYLFDVRELPLSRKKGFSKNILQKILQENNIEYFSFKELGSPKLIRDDLHRTHNYTNFFKSYRKYLQENGSFLEKASNEIKKIGNKNICLMCFEKDASVCHRSVLAEELVKFNCGQNVSNI